RSREAAVPRGEAHEPGRRQGGVPIVDAEAQPHTHGVRGRLRHELVDLRGEPVGAPAERREARLADRRPRYPRRPPARALERDLEPEARGGGVERAERGHEVARRPAWTPHGKLDDRVVAVAARRGRGLDIAAARRGHHVREGARRPTGGCNKEISRHGRKPAGSSGAWAGRLPPTASPGCGCAGVAARAGSNRDQVTPDSGAARAAIKLRTARLLGPVVASPSTTSWTGVAPPPPTARHPHRRIFCLLRARPGRSEAR